MPRPVVPSTPDGESTATLDLSTVPLADRLENQRPGKAADRGNARTDLRDCSCDLLIDPMATGTVKQRSANLHRPRGREALSAHPPTPVDNTPRGASKNRLRTPGRPRPSPPESFSDEEASPPHFERLGKPDAGTARHAAAVRRRIMSTCAAWNEPPTTGEFCDAGRAGHPTQRHRAIGQYVQLVILAGFGCPPRDRLLEFR